MNDPRFDGRSSRRTPRLRRSLAVLGAAMAIASPVLAQWTPCAGASGINLQSLGQRGSYVFAGGAMGVSR